MASYEEILNLRIQGLEDLTRLETTLTSILEGLGQAERRANQVFRRNSAGRIVYRQGIGSFASRDDVNEYVAPIERGQRQRRFFNEARVNTERSIKNADTRIAYESRLNAQISQFDRKIAEFRRGGSGRNLTVEQNQQIQQIERAWEAAGGAQVRSLGLAQALSRELRAIVETQNELNRKGGLRQSTYEQSRRGHERINALEETERAPRQSISRARNTAAQLAEAGAQGNELLASRLRKSLEARLGRMERTIKQQDQVTRLGTRTEELAAKLSAAQSRVTALPEGTGARTLAEGRLRRASEALQGGKVAVANQELGRLDRQLKALADAAKAAADQTARDVQFKQDPRTKAAIEFQNFKDATIKDNASALLAQKKAALEQKAVAKENTLEVRKAEREKDDKSIDIIRKNSAAKLEAEQAPIKLAQKQLTGLVGPQNKLNELANRLERRGDTGEANRLRTTAGQVGNFIDTRRARLDQFPSGTQVATKDFFDQVKQYSADVENFLETMTRRVKSLSPVPPGGNKGGGSGNNDGPNGKQPKVVDLELERQAKLSQAKRLSDQMAAGQVRGLVPGYEKGVAGAASLVNDLTGARGRFTAEQNAEAGKLLVKLKQQSAELKVQEGLEENLLKKEKERFSFASAKQRIGGIVNNIKSGKGIPGQDAENLALGVGFPLLFGGGPGTVAGGAIGSFFGGGFGGQILGGALGGMLDTAVAGVAALGNNLKNLAGDYSIAEQSGLKFNAQLRSQIEDLRASGKGAESQQLTRAAVSDQFGQGALTGIDAGTASVNALSAAWSRFTGIAGANVAGGLSPLIVALASVIELVNQLSVGFDRINQKLGGFLDFKSKVLESVVAFGNLTGINDFLESLNSDYQAGLAKLDEDSKTGYIKLIANAKRFKQELYAAQLGAVGLNANKIPVQTNIDISKINEQKDADIRAARVANPQNTKQQRFELEKQVNQIKIQAALDVRSLEEKSSLDRILAAQQEGRIREDQATNIKRGAEDLARRLQDIDNSRIDLTRQEFDYERSIVDFRIQAENEIARKREATASKEIDNVRLAAQLKAGNVGLALDARAIGADPRIAEAIGAIKSLSQTQIESEADTLRNRGQLELRIAEVRRTGREADRALDKQRIDFERSRDSIIRARIAFERTLEDYRRSTSDYQLNTSRAITDEVRKQQILLRNPNPGNAVPAAPNLSPPNTGGPDDNRIPTAFPLDGIPRAAILMSNRGRSLDQLPPPPPLDAAATLYTAAQASQYVKTLRRNSAGVAPNAGRGPSNAPLSNAPNVQQIQVQRYRADNEEIKALTTTQELNDAINKQKVDQAKLNVISILAGQNRNAELRRQIELEAASFAGLTAADSNEKDRIQLQARRNLLLSQEANIQQEIMKITPEKDKATAQVGLAMKFNQLEEELKLTKAMQFIRQQNSRATESAGIANNIRNFGRGVRAGFAPGSQGAAEYERIASQDLALAPKLKPAIKAQDNLAQRDALGKDISSTLTKGLNDAFMAVLNGGDVRGGFINLLNNLSGRLLQAGMKPLTDTLERAVYGLISPANTELEAATMAQAAATQFSISVEQLIAALPFFTSSFSSNAALDIPGLGGLGGLFSGGAGATLPGLGGILSGPVGDLSYGMTALATGGIVTGPTQALIGEGGQPEAVIPLDQLPGMLGITNNNGAPVINQNIKIDNSGGASVTSNDASRFAAMMQQTALATIRQEQRPGGSLGRRG